MEYTVGTGGSRGQMGFAVGTGIMNWIKWILHRFKIRTVPTWQGMPMRCAVCGNTSEFAVGIRQDYVLCEECNKTLWASINAGNEDLACCRCGYRFLTGWARWFYKNESKARCPHCQARLAASSSRYL